MLEFADPDAVQADYRTWTGTVERPSLEGAVFAADGFGRRGTGPGCPN